MDYMKELRFASLVSLHIYYAFSCPQRVKGRIHDASNPNTGCTINTATGLPKNCVFDIDETIHSTVASLMYAEYLPSVSSRFIAIIKKLKRFTSVLI